MRELTILVEDNLVDGVVDAHRAYLSGKSEDEYLSHHVIEETCESSLELQFAIRNAILDLPDIDLPYTRG